MSINRHALVTRHNVVLTAFDPMLPLTVGNGEFAFTADLTGLQTFDSHYAESLPLCTQAQWGWHSFPLPDGLKASDFCYHPVETPGQSGSRSVGYAIASKNQEPLFHHLRESPHRLHLGRIGLSMRDPAGREAALADLTHCRQELDLWTGRLTSRFEFAGRPVVVETCCAGAQDAVAVRVTSPLVRSGQLRIRFDFPYGSPAMQAADWSRPEAHQTRFQPGENRADFARSLDADRYHATLVWSGDAVLEQQAPHAFQLQAGPDQDTLDFVLRFSPLPPGEPPLDFPQAQQASADFWQTYWTSGAAIELAGSTDPRAGELERRIVLSQYLMRVNCAGSLPPAETGLTCNSWYGKAHLEMHWWHGVHFAQWDRLDLLAKSLGWYHQILPVARQIAQRQGYAGVRWPKMVGPDGIDSPSPVGPLLLWQQPHPIYYAELCYRADPSRKTLEHWREIVEETAAFMGSFVVRDAASGRFDLGPPMKTVSENTDPLATKNAVFDLSYWRFGLRVAQQWRERLGLPRRADWDDLLAHLAPLPTSDDAPTPPPYTGEAGWGSSNPSGRPLASLRQEPPPYPPPPAGEEPNTARDRVYLFQDGTFDTYTKWNWEHPALVGMRGVLPGDGVDAATHKRTVEKVMSNWQWDRCWGWDFPMLAMAAARAGRPDLAVDAFFIQSIKNTYSASGQNYQRPNLPLYLPGNGGLLAAVAMMAAGWDGETSHAPGFPKDWVVRHEGLKSMMAV